MRVISIVEASPDIIILHTIPMSHRSLIPVVQKRFYLTVRNLGTATEHNSILAVGYQGAGMSVMISHLNPG